MRHADRLRLIGKITYYIGWISLLGSALFHLRIATAIFTAITLSKRNLFEIAVVSFLISIASELRARDSAAREMPGVLKKAA
jgi:hypothetical protein